MVLVVTEKNVIAALDVDGGGEIVWRLKYDEEDMIVGYKVDGDGK